MWKKSNSIVIESIDENGYERPSGLEEEEEISREIDNERVRVSLTVQEELLKKMIQRDLIDTGIDDDDFKGEEEIDAVNTKSKKKKNKKKKNKSNTKKDIEGEDTMEGTPSSDDKNNEKENISSGKSKKDFMSKLYFANSVLFTLKRFVETEYGKFKAR